MKWEEILIQPKSAMGSVKWSRVLENVQCHSHQKVVVINVLLLTGQMNLWWCRLCGPNSSQKWKCRIKQDESGWGKNENKSGDRQTERDGVMEMACEVFSNTSSTRLPASVSPLSSHNFYEKWVDLSGLKKTKYVGCWFTVEDRQELKNLATVWLKISEGSTEVSHAL